MLKKLNIAAGLYFLLALMFAPDGSAQEPDAPGDLVLARVRYGGGGDWYNDPSALVNLARYINVHTRIRVSEKEVKISLTEESLSSSPVLFMTGHGKIHLGESELKALRNYLLQGGFLYVDDDYGLDTDFRQLVRELFPEYALQELPFDHGIYHVHYDFPAGPPKIHEHDNKAPQGFGLMDSRNRLMVYYTYETNLSDGWADPDVHHDAPDKREAALKMGVNIIAWALSY